MLARKQSLQKPSTLVLAGVCTQSARSVIKGVTDTFFCKGMAWLLVAYPFAQGLAFPSRAL